MKLNHFHVSSALSLVLIVSCTTAYAQDGMTGTTAPPAKQKDRKGPKPGEPVAPDGGLLSGPAVEVEPENGRPAGPDGPNQASKQRREEQVPLRKWMTALRGVGLSDQQRQDVQAIAKEFQAAAEAQMNKLTPEEREKVRQAMEQRRAGGRDGGSKPGAQIDPAIKELVKKMEEGRPNPTAYQERIWTVLTPEQQAKMKANLAELEKSTGPRPEGQGKRRRAAPQNGGPMAPKGEAEAGDQGDSGMAPPPGKPRDRKGGGAGLDERGRRRAEFLRRHQSGDAAGREPSADERDFTFNEETPAENTDG